MYGYFDYDYRSKSEKHQDSMLEFYGDPLFFAAIAVFNIAKAVYFQRISYNLRQPKPKSNFKSRTYK